MPGALKLATTECEIPLDVFPLGLTERLCGEARANREVGRVLGAADRRFPEPNQATFHETHADTDTIASGRSSFPRLTARLWLRNVGQGVGGSVSLRAWDENGPRRALKTAVMCTALNVTCRQQP
jgi:hypothetical protein